MPTLRMEGTTVDDDEVINEEEELGIDEEKVMTSTIHAPWSTMSTTLA